MFPTFKNLKEVIEKFSDEKVCRAYLEEQLWHGQPVCPHCGNVEKIYKLGDGKTYKCGYKECYKKFTVTVNTIFESSNIKLPTWFAAMYLITAHKKGISSCQLARDLSITQKSAWFVNHRIREMLKEQAPEKLKVHVQADETYVGGKSKNKHKNKRTPNSQGRSAKDKTPVVGLLEKDGKVLCFVVDNTEAGTIQPLMHANVEQGATLVTDSYRSYIGLKDSFKHVVVKHTDGRIRS